MDAKENGPKIHLGAPVSPKPPPPRRPGASLPFTSVTTTTATTSAVPDAGYDVVRAKATNPTVARAEYPATINNTTVRTTATPALTFAAPTKTTTAAIVKTLMSTAPQQTRTRNVVGGAQQASAAGSAAAIDQVLGASSTTTSVTTKTTSSSMPRVITSAISTNRTTTTTAPVTPQPSGSPQASVRGKSPAPARTVVNPATTSTSTANTASTRVATATTMSTAKAFFTAAAAVSNTTARLPVTTTATPQFNSPVRQTSATASTSTSATATARAVATGTTTTAATTASVVNNQAKNPFTTLASTSTSSSTATFSEHYNPFSTNPFSFFSATASTHYAAPVTATPVPIATAAATTSASTLTATANTTTATFAAPALPATAVPAVSAKAASFTSSAAPTNTTAFHTSTYPSLFSPFTSGVAPTPAVAVNNPFTAHAVLHPSSTTATSPTVTTSVAPTGTAALRGRSPAPRAPPIIDPTHAEGSTRGRSPPSRPPEERPRSPGPNQPANDSASERSRSPAPTRSRSPTPHAPTLDIALEQASDVRTGLRLAPSADQEERGRSPSSRSSQELPAGPLGVPVEIVRTRQRSADFTMSPSIRFRDAMTSASAPGSPAMHPAVPIAFPPPGLGSPSSTSSSNMSSFVTSSLPSSVTTASSSFAYSSVTTTTATTATTITTTTTTTTTTTPTTTSGGLTHSTSSFLGTSTSSSFTSLASAVVRRLSPAPPNRVLNDEPKRSRSPAPPRLNNNSEARRGSEGHIQPPMHLHSLSISAEMMSPRAMKLDTPRRASIPAFSGSPRPFLTHAPPNNVPAMSLDSTDPANLKPSEVTQPEAFGWRPQARLTPRARFGDPIEAWVGSDAVRLRYTSPIPRVLVNLRGHLIDNDGLRFVGVFRLSPDATNCSLAKEQINNGTFDWDATDDVVITSSLMKQWFGGLPDKRKLLDQLDPDHIPIDDISKDQAKNLIEGLQDPMRSVALWLLDFCVLVSSHCEDNKMTAGNLAICMAPNLTSCEDFQIVRRKFTQLWQVAITWRQGEFHPYFHQTLSQSAVRLQLRALCKATREHHEIKRSNEVKEWLCRFSLIVRSSLLDVDHIILLVTLETFGLIFDTLRTLVSKSHRRDSGDVKSYVDVLEHLWQFMGPFAPDPLPKIPGVPALPANLPPALPTSDPHENLPPLPHPATMPSLPKRSLFSPLLSTAPFLVLRRTVCKPAPALSSLEDFAPELKKDNWTNLQHALDVANVLGDVATRLSLAKKTEFLFAEHFAHLEEAFSFCRYLIWADLQKQNLINLEAVSDVELEDIRLEGQLWRKIGILGKSRGGSFKKNPFWFRLTEDALMLCSASYHDQVLEVIHLNHILDCKPLKSSKPVPQGQERFTVTCKNDKGGTVDFLFLASVELHEKLREGVAHSAFF